MAEFEATGSNWLSALTAVMTHRIRIPVKCNCNEKKCCNFNIS